MNDKDLMKKLYMMTNEEIEIEEFRKSLGVTDSWHIEAEIKETPAERKKRLMRLEKEMLVDMVFDLESRNEFLLHNLSEVEKMYNKLKEEKEYG